MDDFSKMGRKLVLIYDCRVLEQIFPWQVYVAYINLTQGLQNFTPTEPNARFNSVYHQHHYFNNVCFGYGWIILYILVWDFERRTFFSKITAFVVSSQKFGEEPVLRTPLFTKVFLNSFLVSLFFFVLIQKRTKKNQGCFHFLTLN